MQFIRSLTGSKRVIFIVLTIIVVALVGRSILLREPDTENKYTVVREDLVDTIQVSGTYEIGMQKEVVSTATGVITELFVTDGQVVEQGDPLFHVQSTATEEEKSAALSAYLAAQAAHDGAKAMEKNLQSDMFSKWDTFKELAEDNEYENDDGTPKEAERAVPEFHVPEKQWQAAEDTYKNQQTVVSQTGAALTKAYLDYQATQNITINAPASGTVVNLLKKAGDQVLSERGTGQNAKSAETVLVVANLDNPHVNVLINETYLPRVSKGLPAVVVFDALPAEEFHGTLDAIETIGSGEAGVIQYKARINLNDVNDQVLPGMTAVVSVETNKTEDVLTVPNSALITKDGSYFVVSSHGSGTGDLIGVEIGTQGIAKTEITSGLEEGVVIATNPPLQ